MEQRIVDYIVSKLDRGNIQAWCILVNISVEMVKENKSEEDIKNRIDSLLKDPCKRKR